MRLKQFFFSSPEAAVAKDYEDATLSERLQAQNRDALAKREAIRAKSFATKPERVKAVDQIKHKFPYHGLVDCKVADKSYSLFTVNDDIVAWMFFWSGEFEKPLLELWHKLTRRGGTALDIGAYSGLYAMVAAGNGCNTHAFELMLRTAERAKINFRLNGLDKKITLHPYGLSDEDRQVNVFMPRVSDFLGTGNSIDPKANVEAVERAICAVRDFHAVAETEPLKDVRAIKIDVEGHELTLLGAMRQLIERDLPEIIIEISRDVPECKALLEEMGYVLNQLDGANFHATPLKAPKGLT